MPLIVHVVDEVVDDDDVEVVEDDEVVELALVTVVDLVDLVIGGLVVRGFALGTVGLDATVGGIITGDGKLVVNLTIVDGVSTGSKMLGVEADAGGAAGGLVDTGVLPPAMETPAKVTRPMTSAAPAAVTKRRLRHPVRSRGRCSGVYLRVDSRTTVPIGTRLAGGAAVLSPTATTGVGFVLRGDDLVGGRVALRAAANMGPPIATGTPVSDNQPGPHASAAASATETPNSSAVWYRSMGEEASARSTTAASGSGVDDAT